MANGYNARFRKQLDDHKLQQEVFSLVPSVGSQCETASEEQLEKMKGTKKEEENRGRPHFATQGRRAIHGAGIRHARRTHQRAGRYPRRRDCA